VINKKKKKSIPSKDTVDHNDKMISRSSSGFLTTPDITTSIYWFCWTNSVLHDLLIQFLIFISLAFFTVLHPKMHLNNDFREFVFGYCVDSLEKNGGERVPGQRKLKRVVIEKIKVRFLFLTIRFGAIDCHSYFFQILLLILKI